MFAWQGREYLLNGRRNDLTRICPYGRGNDRNSSERRVVGSGLCRPSRLPTGTSSDSRVTGPFAERSGDLITFESDSVDDAIGCAWHRPPQGPSGRCSPAGYSCANVAHIRLAFVPRTIGRRQEMTGTAGASNPQAYEIPRWVPRMGDSSRDRPEVTPNLQVAATKAADL
jgi:hypothetical protein